MLSRYSAACNLFSVAAPMLALRRRGIAMSFQKNNTTMNITHTTQPIIHKDDHAIISSYLGTEATEPLKVKLEKAKIVPQDEFPRDAVRLHSRVTVRDKMARMNFTYHMSLPGGNQSVTSNIGMAILGLKKGEEVKLQFKNSKKYYIVMEVSNPV